MPTDPVHGRIELGSGMPRIKQGVGLNLAVDISGSGPQKNKLWGLTLLYGKCHSFFNEHTAKLHPSTALDPRLADH